MINFYNNFLNIFTDFKSNLLRVSNYIDLCDGLDNEANNGNLSNDNINLLLKTRLVSYNAIIISIYGLWENFIKKILKEYIKTNINLFSDLDQCPRSKYFEACLKSISYKTDNYVQVIKSLYDMESSNNYSGVITDLLFEDGANLKIKQLRRLITDAGLENLYAETIQQEEFIKKYKVIYQFDDIDAARRNINNNSSFFDNDINQLVDSRNQIAHHGFEPNMLNKSDLKCKTIPMMIALCESLTNKIFICILKKCNSKYGAGEIEYHISKNELSVKTNYSLDENTFILLVDKNNKLYNFGLIKEFLLTGNDEANPEFHIYNIKVDISIPNSLNNLCFIK